MFYKRELEVFITNANYDPWTDYLVACENIRRVLSGIPPEVVADLLFVTEHTVKAWRYGKRFPDYSRLIMLAWIAGQDLTEFVGLKLPDAEPEEIMRMLRPTPEGHPDEKPRRKNWLYESKEELLQKLLFDLYKQRSSHIETIGDFLLYLPLLKGYTLCDFFYRTTGNITSEYLFEKVQDLYDSIPKSPEKQYADNYRYFYMTSPCIVDIPLDTVLPHEREKLDKYNAYKDSGKYAEDEAAYLRRLWDFRQRLSFPA